MTKTYKSKFKEKKMSETHLHTSASSDEKAPLMSNKGEKQIRNVANNIRNSMHSDFMNKVYEHNDFNTYDQIANKITAIGNEVYCMIASKIEHHYLDHNTWVDAARSILNVYSKFHVKYILTDGISGQFRDIMLLIYNELNNGVEGENRLRTQLECVMYALSMKRLGRIFKKSGKYNVKLVSNNYSLIPYYDSKGNFLWFDTLNSGDE